MKTLDLTYVHFCNERTEIAKRNQRAKAYSDSVKVKQRKTHNVKENLNMLASIICINSVILYVLIDALL